MNIVVKYSLLKKHTSSGIIMHLLSKLEFRKIIQKQSCADALQNGYSSQFHKIHMEIHMETPALEFVFNKIADWKPATLLKKRLRYRYFLLNFVKFVTEHLQITASGHL